MKAIIGLGNPGIKFYQTRHNVGFMLIDLLVREKDYVYRNDFRGKFAEGRQGAERIFLLKPYTYMNLSGLAASELVCYYKIPSSEILVLVDDMDLPLGKIRLRSKGSSGGHNGMKSIIRELGVQDFWRLKIGVGRPKEHQEVINHVLTTFNKEETKVLDDVMAKALQVVTLWLENRGEEAMNTYN
ncbi:MAG: Peptidyl-tRNA hydrolase [Candidatus Dichloromethanomonas elyunquensis]|nr:MAG: Peptidyl-tRNA hydrolase [Candidatus Dichloromethanomonas elyunquensis]